MTGGAVTVLVGPGTVAVTVAVDLTVCVAVIVGVADGEIVSVVVGPGVGEAVTVRVVEFPGTVSVSVMVGPVT